MNLPSGVRHMSLQKQLIAADADAVIRIDTRADEANGKYNVVPRLFDASFEQCLKGEWDAFDRIFRLERLDGSNRKTVYATATHDGTPRRPRITVVPNLRAENKSARQRELSILGCTLGREYPRDPAQPVDVREVHEFLTFGMMLIDDGSGEVDLWVAREGDKVVVTGGVNIALYNLGESPLITLAFAGDGGKVEEEKLAKALGPMLLVRYDDLEVGFVISDLYINNTDVKAGVRVPPAVLEKYGRTIRLQRTSRDDLGTFLYEQLTRNPALIARLAKLGIRVRTVATDAVLRSASSDGTHRSLFFSRPLARATEAGTRVHRFFFPDASPTEPGDARDRPRPPQQPLTTPYADAAPLDRPLVVVVEGAGGWVRDAYRPAFRTQIDAGRRVSVFYADDTNWQPPREDGTRPKPEWAHRGMPDGLEEWEVYLDKADPEDALRYATLRPDAVFVVTPDFTHSATARFWLDKAPVVFVEKPFDSQIRNVEDLQFSFSARPRTEVVGLDHYQFYAERLQDLQPEIESMLGRRILGVKFALAERAAIEVGRDRSLQHGLSLDLMPHFLALLTFFGDIRTIDEISVPRAWVYEPLEARSKKNDKVVDISRSFRNETGAILEFTFEDYSGNGYRVPCRAVIGKGFAADVKYMDVLGETKRTLRIDLTPAPPPKPDAAPTDPTKPQRSEYPWDSVFFLGTAGDPVAGIDDPYRPGETLHALTRDGEVWNVKLERKRYRTLLTDLLNGTEIAAFSSLSMAQGAFIVKILDRLWWAIQHSKPWGSYPLQQLDAVQALEGSA